MSLTQEQLQGLQEKFIPQNQNIIVYRDEIPTTNNNGLVLQNVQTGVKSITGTVVLSDDDNIKVGTQLIFGSMSGVNFEINNIKLTSLKIDDLIGKFN